MKKLVIFILGALVGALATYYLTQTPDTEKVSTLDESTIDVSQLSHVIPIDSAKVLNDNWTKFRKPALDSITQRLVRKNDNRWAWWSLDDIKTYMKYVKKEARKNNYTVDGYRFYFGAYGEQKSADKACLSTLFMVPTGKVNDTISKASILNLSLMQGNGKDLPIDPLNDGNGGQGGYPH